MPQEIEMQITVNGDRHDIPRGDVDYATICRLAGHPDAKALSITYQGPRNGDSQRSGILMPGKSVAGEDGMIFNAYNTGNA